MLKRKKRKVSGSDYFLIEGGWLQRIKHLRKGIVYGKKSEIA